MRALLRCVTTGLFLTADGNWTAAISEARVFDDMRSLWKARELNPALVLEIYYSFAEARVTEWDFALPLLNTPRTGKEAAHAE